MISKAKHKFKVIMATIFEGSGVNTWRRKRLQKAIIILTYHGVIPDKLINKTDFLFEYRNVVSQEEFDRQMAYLARYYTPISFKDFTELEKRDESKPFVVVTFDDGFENNYTYAYPILKKHGIVGHFFVTTDFMGSRQLLWTEEVNYRVFHTKEIQLSIPVANKTIVLPLKNTEQREQASIQLRKILKLSKLEIIEKALVALRQATADVDVKSLPRERYQFLSWEQIQEMHRNGMIFGSHTNHHYLLNTLTTEQVKNTLKLSKQILEEKLQTPCVYFSYPNGDKENFDPDHYRILEELGFSFAFTQIPGFNSVEQLQSQRFSLNRINISYFMMMPIFNAIINGIWRH